MIIHTPGTTKNWLDISNCGLAPISLASVITYRDNDNKSMSDIYGSITINNGQKCNAEKVYDIAKYIIENADNLKDYIVIIDCNDVIMKDSDIQKMIDDGYDLYISHYYRANEVRHMEGAFINSGCIFGNKAAVMLFAKTYIDAFNMSKNHTCDEGLVAATLLIIMRMIRINVSNKYIKTINIFNIADEYNSHRDIFFNRIDKVVSEINRTLSASLRRHKHDGCILKIE